MYYGTEYSKRTAERCTLARCENDSTSPTYQQYIAVTLLAAGSERGVKVEACATPLRANTPTFFESREGSQALISTAGSTAVESLHARFSRTEHRVARELSCPVRVLPSTIILAERIRCASWPNETRAAD